MGFEKERKELGWPPKNSFLYVFFKGFLRFSCFFFLRIFLVLLFW